MPGGESFDDFCSRFLPDVADALAETANGARILMVTHSHNLKLARAWLESGRQPVSGKQFMAPAPGPAAVLACEAEGGGWIVREVLADGVPTSAAAGSVPPEVHYRPSDTAGEECASCSFYLADSSRCSMFPGDPEVIPDYVCDEWVAAAAAITSGGTMATTVKLSEGGAGEIFVNTSTTGGITFELTATGDTNLPLSERDRAWDAGAAGGRVKKWASSDGSGDPDKIDYSKLKRAYFWQTTAAAGGPKIGDFKLPFADIVGGKLTAVWRGVTSGAQRLSSTDGIDKAAVQAKMSTYYSKAAKTYGDASIKAPWAGGSALADGEALAAIRAQLADQGADGILGDDELRAVLLAFAAAQGFTASAQSAATDEDERALLAAVSGGTPWQATLCVAGEPTVDSGIKRLLIRDGGSWLPLPLPLALLDDSPHADVTTKAPIVGRIDQIWWAGDVCQASGVFFDDSDDPKLQEQAGKGAALVGEMRRMGISVDLVDIDVEMMVWNGSSVAEPMDYLNDPTAPDEPQPEANLPLDIPEAAEENVEPEADDLEYVYAFTQWVIGGATICPVQALTDATISLVASAFERRAEWRSVSDFELGGAVLTAAAAGLVPLEPPSEWFSDPELDGPTPLTITDEGRVYGHLATWGTCHTGLPGCVPPPRSPTGYMNFHLGEIKTAEGDRVPVGTLTFDAPHAPHRLGATATIEHYDNTATAGAHVRAGEDAWGIWLAGALNPRLSAEDARTLMAAPPSGDWRQVRQGEGRDLVGAHAVNQPGFPVRREGLHLAASAGCDPCEEAFARDLAVEAASADGIEGLAALVE